jgi:tRNA pseudouridine38-40 synthase
VKAERLRRFSLTVQYDGTYFLGWQLQAMDRTVQGEMERTLETLTGARRPVVAAGRTDSGVHATGQSVAVSVPSRWSAQELHKALNACLPHDIWVKEVREAPLDFHPRFAAIARSYRYQVGLAPAGYSPFHRPWCWPLEQEVDVNLLHRGAALLPGKHSFKAFAKAGQEFRGHECRVTHANWLPWNGVGLAFQITANRFLHHMVRYLVGTMVDVALKRRPLDEIGELLLDPQTAAVTSAPAPSQGLFLAEVHYPDAISALD